jgi:hypothetical protein
VSPFVQAGDDSELRDTSPRFVVRQSFVMTGFGTVAAGYFESGHGRSGDGLEWWHDGTLHVGRCAAVVTIREVPIQDPVTVGIVIDGASPYDIREGDVITVHSAEP